jgi:hypothetical protein
MARSTMLRELWGIERVTVDRDAYAMDATNGYHGAHFVAPPCGFGPESTHVRLQVSSSGRTPYRAGTLRYQNRVVWRCGHRRHSLHDRSSALECAAAALRRFQEGHIGLPHSLAQRLQPYDVRLLTNALGRDAPSPPTLAPSIRGALPLPIWKKVVFMGTILLKST